MIKIFQSTIEKSAWLIILLIFIAIAIEVPLVIHIVHQNNLAQQQIKQGVQHIEKEQNCIAKFFLQPERQNITIKNLACSETIK